MLFHNRIEMDVARTATTPLRAYIDDFLIACEAGSHMRRPLSEYTIRGYRKTLCELDRLMGEPALAGLTEPAVQNIITAKRKVSKSSARLMAATAKSFATWLQRKKYTDDNRLEDLPVPVFNGRRRSFNDKDFRSILSALSELPNRTRKRDRALVLFAAGSGLRSNELRTMLLEDVHIVKPLSNSWARVRWDETKTQKERMVRISEDAAMALHDYLVADRPETRKDEPFFLSEEGRSYSYAGWQKMFGRVADRLEAQGIEGFGAHRLRHQWATMGARTGMTYYELCQEGGWARGSRVPSQYVDEIPFEEMQRKASPMTAFLRRVV